MRLIDADALEALHCEECGAVSKGICKEDPVCATLMWLREAPTINPADLVTKGRWIEHDCFKCNSRGEPVIKTGAVFVCSECGREERYREPFCHCGADMREVVDHA